MAIQDRKQANGYVIMTKAGYLHWLKQNEHTIIGFVGSQVQGTPIKTYALSLELSFLKQSMPRWAETLNEAYSTELISGQVRGCQAMTMAQKVLGYHFFFLHFV